MLVLGGVLLFIVGGLIGGYAVWFFVQSHTKGLEEHIRLEEQGQKNLLQQEIRNLENRYQEIQTRYQDCEGTVQEQLAEINRQTGEVSRLQNQVQENSKRISELLEEKRNHEAELENKQNRINALTGEVSELKQIVKGEQEKLQEWQQAETRLRETFQALSQDALKSNGELFLRTAKEVFEKLRESAKGDLEQKQQAIDLLIKPIQENLVNMNTQIAELEKKRLEAYTGLLEQVKNLQETQLAVQAETNKLVRALSQPQARGRWGEVTLHRVVEISGMSDYVDYEEQVTLQGEDGKYRPDMVIKLPNNRTIAVDAKAPIDEYLKGLEAVEEDKRKNHLLAYKKAIEGHAKTLASREYWSHLKTSPEFVILFLPGESFFSAALEQDPALIENALKDKVLLATPTTLISLLKAVSYGWNQDNLARNAEEIKKLAKELVDRLGVYSDHFEEVGKGLKKAVDGYNKAKSSFDSRLLPTATRIKELGVSSRDIKEIPFAENPAGE